MVRPAFGSPALVVAVLAAALQIWPGPARARSTSDSDRARPQPRTDEFAGWWHDAGQLLLHVSNRGFFGRRGSDPGAPSAEWPAGSNHEYLYAAGLWVGGVVGPDTLVTNSLFQTFEFFNHESEGCGDPLQGICTSHEGAPGGRRLSDDDGDGRIDEDPLDGEDNDGDGRIDEDFAAISDQMYRTAFYDSSTFFNQFQKNPENHHAPLGVEVTQESYVWTRPELDDFVGVEYHIKNVSHEIDGVGWEISNAYLGVLVDSDVGFDSDALTPWSDDHAAFIEADTTVGVPGGSDDVRLQMGYMFDESGLNGDDVPGYLGVMLFGHTVDTTATDLESSTAPRSVGVHVFRIWAGGGQDPRDDLDRYRFLRGLFDTARSIDPPTVRENDYRYLISAGPFNAWHPDSTLVLQLAFVSGQMLTVPGPARGLARVPDLTNPIMAQRVYNGYYDPDTGEWVRWAVDHPPAAPHLEATAGNGIAVVRWEDLPEGVPDRITGELDFAGYRIERAGPSPKSGPLSEWSTVAELDTTDLAAMHTSDPRFPYELTDRGLRNFGWYRYRVRSWDRGGLVSDPDFGVQVRPRATTSTAPEPIRVQPNPVRASIPGSVVRFLDLPEGAAVRIYGISGRMVAELRPGSPGPAGEVAWSPTAAGMYFYRVTSPGGTAKTGKLVVLR